MKKRSFWLGGLVLLTAWLAAYYGLVRPAFLTWGATAEEAARVFPADVTPAAIEYQCTRALTIGAPPEKVWERFVQLGIGRSGYYSYTWMENMFLAGIRNDFRIVPEWQNRPDREFVRSLQFGALKAGANGWAFDILEPGRVFFLNPGWGPFVMEAEGIGGTRVLIRSMAAGPVKIWAKIPMTIILDPVYFFMEKRMMNTIGNLAEGRPPFAKAGTAAAHAGFVLIGLLAAGVILTRPRKKIWILVPLAWAGAVLATTKDLQAALVAFVAGGLITAGFRLLGRRGWLLVLGAWIYAYLILIYARDAYVFFGLAFFPLAIAAGLGAGLLKRKGPVKA
ncbi:MAG: hypothetical protein NTZ26_00465 [Candidatus Aminicenantes bacterium]|nr:hypothetical protein [Candidatus Aminicenantes bacterium]